MRKQDENPAKTINGKEKRKSQFYEIWRRMRKNRMAMIGLIIILLLFLSAVFAGFLAPYGIDDQNTKERFLGPSLQHLFGTDQYGRDIFSRVLYGGRISLTIGLVSTSISGFFGIILGSIAGYYGGRLDNVIMRILDVFMSLPTMLTAIVVSAVLGPGIGNCMLALGIATTPRFARVVRGPILQIRNQEYIEAAHAIDLSTPQIIWKHILPNVLAPIIVQATLYIAGAVIAAAGLSFVGLGVQPPSSEWGAMLSAGRAYIRDCWWIVTFPGIAILLTCFSLNVLGDGLRDALDPRLKN